ncbi:Awp1-pending-prov protein [Thecamonas trahens ATCC 50062]|uniref:Awp1-pending-prov protein n=1 Tax=Thecamonas trahens ATCC 50062 TaxID=461836 RepID=A0A0L0D6H4_THETB|nr:Awp1-pending-prov protein [Thecamonas trahens ATCC 50062]KNC46908.1 Awp1-pending-prov protein [Thecamonas trahens ATCC 50062]|eukprot:XP_013760181.1 Awp1-pending-prov protein [Thecamonas trahens ATCC 50062]
MTSKNPGLECAAGCGFCGTAQNDGLCSVCFAASKPRSDSAGCLGLTSMDIPRARKADLPPEAISDAAAAGGDRVPRPSAPVPMRATPLIPGALTLSQDSPEASALPPPAIAPGPADSLAPKAIPIPATPAPAPAPVPAPSTEAAPPPVQPLATASASSGKSRKRKRPQGKKNRCYECRKKVGLHGFTCECDFVFCGKHRYRYAHQCEVDVRERARKQLASLNTGRTTKIIKI